jgi:uncharacterized glyoxalase superfamily protein PhnB
LSFLLEVFNGEAIEKLLRPDGSINHAEVKIGDSIVMFGETADAGDAVTSMLYVYVPDTDATYETALKAGGTSVREPADQYYGDRSAAVKGPCGNMWFLATHIEEVPRDELLKRAAEASGQ